MALTNNSHTKITAENTFTNGLVMDFSPENTPSSVLTNALNATFITFNGNENTLQNDMGNARVNAAYLPTGYIPVGTCEFGDIIYIVSYNPIENKSQIGCFPSPERNISNKEVSKLIQSVDKSEFVNYYKSNNLLISSGIIKSSTAKKIVYGNSNINPGDKFLISWGAEGIQNKKYISNFGNESKNIDNVETYWPKLMLVHVVSIEDSGKVTKLDSTVKWYTNGSGSDSASFIVSDEDLNNDSNVATVDSYRNALLCLYSVFQSKTAGKLALYFELETINNFSCGHKIFQRTVKTGTDVTGKDIKETYYDIYLSASWETDNYNINPCGMIITDSEFFHMEPVDASKLYLDDLKASGVTEEDKQRSIYAASRVIEFSRTYKVEDYLGQYSNKTYKDFLNDSYYTQIENYRTVKIPYSTNVDTPELDSSKVDPKTSLYTVLASRAVRVYSYNTEGYKYPKTLDDIGVYVINPDKSTKVTSANKADIESAYRGTGISLTEGEYFYQTRIDSYWGACIEITIPDDVVVNYFKRSVLKKLATVKKTDWEPVESKTSVSDAEAYTAKDLQEFKIRYTVCPCMPYGVLDSLAITNTINFSDNQDGTVELATWLYYVNTTSIVLKFGFTPHLKEAENEVIDKVVMQFYDALGVCASYELTGLDSYDATFTEYFELDRIPSNSRFSSKKLTTGSRNVSTQIYRRGPGKYSRSDITESNKYSYYIDFGDRLQLCAALDLSSVSGGTVYQQTAGVLYYGRPYGVRIFIFKGVLTELGEVDTSGYDDPIIYDRWIWTAPIFNDAFNSTLDFKDCELRTGLDFLATLDSRAMALQQGSFIISPKENVDETAESTFRAKVDYINAGNITCKGTSVLVDNYGKSLYLNSAALDEISIKITTNNDNTITFDSEDFTTEYEELYICELPDLYPKYDNTKTFSDIYKEYPSLINANILSKASTDLVITDLNKKRDRLVDSFELNLNDAENSDSTDFAYIDSSGRSQSLNTTKYIKMSGKKWKDEGVTLTLSGVKFTKVLAATTTAKSSNSIYGRVLESTDDLTTYGLGIKSGNKGFYHPTLHFFGINEDSGEDGYIGMGLIAFNSDLTSSRITSYNRWENGNNASVNFDNNESKYKVFASHLLTPLLFIAPDVSTDHKAGMHIPGTDLTRVLSGSWERGVGGDCFGTGNYIYVNWERIVVSDWKDYRNVGVCLTFLDADSSIMRVGADFRVYLAELRGIIRQLFWLSINGAENYADLIGSLLYNCFIKKEIQYNYYDPSNLANIKKYTETWNKDIIVELTISNTFADNSVFNENTSSSTLITILPGYTNALGGVTTVGINLFADVRLILAKMYDIKADSIGINGNFSLVTEHNLEDTEKPLEFLTFNNINPIIQKSTKSINFLYSIPYTPNSVKLALNVDSTKTGFVRIYEGGNDFKYILVVPPTDETKVYGYNKDTKSLLVIRNSSGLAKVVSNISTGTIGTNYNVKYLNATLSKYDVPLTNSGFFNCLRNSSGSLILLNTDLLKDIYNKYYMLFDDDGRTDSNWIYGLIKTYIFDGLNAW